jgi:glycosyltransferase involved in cell wall biosynthesis
LKNKNILFYDQHISGHHLEYIGHLVEYSRTNNKSNIIFAIRQEAINEIAKNTPKGVRFFAAPISSSDSLVKKSLEEGKWLVKIIQREKITDLVFLAIDPYQYLLGVRWFRKLPCDMHGILFSPPHRLYPSPQSPIKEKIKQSVRRKRKALQLHWALRNKQLKSLFILDDSDGVDTLNKRFRPIFQLLNDPIEQGIRATTTPLNIKSTDDEKLLLSFGGIHPRKNLVNIVNSLQFCDDYPVTLLIAGKGETEYVLRLRETAVIYENNPNINVVIDNRFVSHEEMDGLFAAADGIIMVYKNFYGSSGVLGQSAKHATPVLVANEGLIPALTLRYRLGVAVAGDPISIGLGIQKLLRFGLSSDYGGLEYLAPKTPTKFCETIFSVLEPLTEV